MKRGLLTAWVLVLLTGCASYDRKFMTEFQPIPGTDGQRFVFTVTTDNIYKEDDPDDEATRADWLKTSIGENHYCPSGYTVTSRRALKNAYGGYHIHYEGVCN